MSDQFIGLTMLVTLNSPPGAQLRGTVSSIVAGQSLTLREVYCPGNGRTITEITIKATDIMDLAEAVDENIPPQVVHRPVPASVVPDPRRFDDPAILSMGRKPVSQRSTPSVPIIGGQVPSFHAVPPQEPVHVVRDITPAAKLADAMSNLAFEDQEDRAEIGVGLDDVEQTALDLKRARTRKRRHNRKKGAAATEADDTVPEVIPVSETKRGKGWRQTPLLEPNPSFQPFSTLKKKHKGNGYDNGWATEDATDVQDMGDFDFESNLSKFDKRTIFEGIRAEDMTADEDRLVGHNRIARPGTLGGKNLHPTENVLDLVNDKPAWNSEADESDVYALKGSQRDTGSGRGSRRGESRRGESKLRKSASRKEFTLTESQPMRRQTSNQPDAATKSCFFLMPENRRCELISALQMLNLENIADSEFGLTEDMMAENAGRGLAQLSLSAIDANARPRGRDTAGVPCIVVFAGNNKSGLRAVAAARHLRSHGINALVCVLGLEREPELLEGLRKQLKVFRSFGGKVFSKTELMDHVKSLGTGIDLIIDGLLGLTISFEELRTGDQATAYELIEWANRHAVEVMAIDIPTGIDPSTGKVSIIDGKPLYIHPTIVVAMGVPKKGLLQAMISGEGAGSPDDDSAAWNLFVADIGIGKQALKKAGTRMRRGVEFDRTWTMELRFHKGVD